MAVKIKLQRLGKIRNPHYRIIVADSRTRREGQAIEVVGLYNPKPNPSQIEVKSERVQYWLGVGAQPTDPVKAILKVTGDWQTFKGLPGKEGTLKVAEPKPSKQEIFAKALEDADKEAVAEATTPKKKKANKKEAADTDKNKTADKSKVADTKAEAADAVKTDTPVEEAKAEKAVSE